MAVFRSRFTLILLIAAVWLPGANVTAATKRKRAAKLPVKQEQPAPTPVVAPPPVELTPEQKPAVAPQVTYRAGQLTIVAENSTLGDILRAVRSQTGAAIDVPANANSRVATRLGPGPARDVLASLLNGSLFNYVLLGTAANPAGVARVILTPKLLAPGSAENPPQNNAMGRPGQVSYPMANLQPQMAADEAENDAENEAEEAPSVDPAEASPVGVVAQPGVKTPEQMLQELQRQQQQLQIQQQQQGNPPTGQAPEQNSPPPQ